MSAMPRLELVVRGMKRMQAGVPSKPRLPITLEILHNNNNKIKAVQTVGSHHAVMYLCFFGFLQAGKAVVPEKTLIHPYK